VYSSVFKKPAATAGQIIKICNFVPFFLFLIVVSMVERSQLFERFCSALLDRLAKAKGVTEKKHIFGTYIQDWRREYGPNCYDPLRLLMPIVNMT
jgi:hypothetical protein